ncbi:hypothetical protein PSPO01_13559 [Paraphaeosphaeria sporulosa]
MKGGEEESLEEIQRLRRVGRNPEFTTRPSTLQHNQASHALHAVVSKPYKSGTQAAILLCRACATLESPKQPDETGVGGHMQSYLPRENRSNHETVFHSSLKGATQLRQRPIPSYRAPHRPPCPT